MELVSIYWYCLAFLYVSGGGYNKRKRTVYVNSFPLPLIVASRARRSSIDVPLWAKAPPTSKFDLDSIESYESDLMERDRLLKEATKASSGGVAFDENCLKSSDIEVDQVRMYTVTSTLDKMRLDVVVAALIESDDSIITKVSRSVCGNLVSDGHVTVQGRVDTRKSTKVEAGSALHIRIPSTESTATRIIAQDISLSILFEDEHMIVLNKAAGMVVHPAAGNWDGTVVNALAYYLQYTSPYSVDTTSSDDFFLPIGPGAVEDTEDDEEDQHEGDNGVYGSSLLSLRPGIVHRLDKGTTGVLVVAKTSASLAALSEQFSTRRVSKTYLAVTVGNPGKRVVIDKPIGRHPVFRQRMRVVPDPHQKDSSGTTPSHRRAVEKGGVVKNGRRALSLVNTIAFDGKLAFVQVRIETGRTHQIRVHLQDRHTPIYGDDVYGLADWNKRLSKTHSVTRPLLHAYRLQIEHPVTGESMVFQAPLADDMRKVVATIYPDGNGALPDVFHVPEEDEVESMMEE